MKAVRLSLVLGVAFGISVLRAADYNYWQAVDGDYSGRWGDAAHWSAGHVPADGETATIDPTRATPSEHVAFSIDVDGEYATDSLIVGDPDNVTRKISVTFTGSGKVTCAGKTSSIFRCCTAIVFDGPTFLLGGTGNVLNYSPVTVKGGSLLQTESGLIFWKLNNRLTVDDGGTVSVKSVDFNERPYGITVNAGGRFVCRQVYQPYGGTESSGDAFGLTVNGGEAEINTLRLTRPAAFVKMASGSLTLVNAPTLCDFSQLQVTGGSLRYGFTVVQDESDPYYALAQGVDWTGCGVLKATNDVTFTSHKTFFVSQLCIADRTKPARIDCDRLVFDGLNWPFKFDFSGNRYLHLYGPTDLHVAGRNLNGFNNHYILCHGRITVHTEDWNDAATKRTVAIRGLGSADGSLDLVATGGGTFKYGQVWSYESLRSLTVEEGTALVLGNRDVKLGNTAEWGPVSTERLTLEKDVTVAFTAGEQHIASSEWAIDPSVRITVTIPETYTSERIAFPAGAYPVLQDLDSKALPDELLSQIALAGDAEGWSLVNEKGQISVVKRDSSSLGTFGEFEWLGGAGDNCWRTVGNWNGGTPVENKAHVFGASENLSVYFDGAVAGGGGTTLGSITFKDCAVRSFFIDGNKQATFNSSPAVMSYSYVPQRLAVGMRWVGSARQLASYNGGVIVMAANPANTTTTSWEIKKGNDGSLQYVGDIRTDNTVCSNVRNLTPVSNRVNFPSYRTCFTVLKGGNFTFARQTGHLYAEGATFRVSAGGALNFSADSASFYAWSKKPASIVVNGTLNVGPQFRGGVDQVYRGAGTVNLDGGVAPYSASSRVGFSDALTVNLSSDWTTSAAGVEDLALSLGATTGSPVIRVPDGWKYGVPAGVATTTTASQRAFSLENGAVAYLDPQGGTATLSESVSGFGTLAVTNGTLVLAASSVATEAEVAACADAALRIESAQTLAGLVLAKGAAADADADLTLGRLAAEGASLDLGEKSVLHLTDDADLTGVTLAFSGAPGWRTLVRVTGTLAGNPTVDSYYRIRRVEREGETLFQVRDPGTLILVR